MTSRRLIAARKAALAALATIDRIDRMTTNTEGSRIPRKDAALDQLAIALDALYGPLPPPTVLEEAVRARYARCGTVEGHRTHIEHGTPPCRACRLAIEEEDE